MPDPKQMSGIPRPVDDLPAGSVSVRLIRGRLTNNIAGHPVDLLVGGKKQTVKTDDGGRAPEHMQLVTTRAAVSAWHRVAEFCLQGARRSSAAPPSAAR